MSLHTPAPVYSTASNGGDVFYFPDNVANLNIQVTGASGDNTYNTAGQGALVSGKLASPSDWFTSDDSEIEGFFKGTAYASSFGRFAEDFADITPGPDNTRLVVAGGGGGGGSATGGGGGDAGLLGVNAGTGQNANSGAGASQIAPGSGWTSGNGPQGGTGQNGHTGGGGGGYYGGGGGALSGLTGGSGGGGSSFVPTALLDTFSSSLTGDHPSVVLSYQTACTRRYLEPTTQTRRKREMRILEEKKYLQANPECPHTSRACPLPSGNFECIDFGELSSCGGCVTSGTGVDCLAIPGVNGVGCINDECIASGLYIAAGSLAPRGWSSLFSWLGGWCTVAGAASIPPSVAWAMSIAVTNLVSQYLEAGTYTPETWHSCYVVASLEAPIHLAEESSDAAYVVPTAMMYGSQVTAVLGFLTVIVFGYTVSDLVAALSSPYGLFAQFMADTIGRKGSIALSAIIIADCWFTGLSCSLCSSRIVFATARDGMLPFSRVWRVINHRTQTPVNATLFGVPLAALLGLLAFAGPTAISSIFSIATMMIPILCFPSMSAPNAQTMSYTALVFGGFMLFPAKDMNIC
ncbi:APC amino acid permease [Pseudohyphozyma bogoriensis]|nr:APC amino acid permease [Pseudohyphozyma bogoriensis]